MTESRCRAETGFGLPSVGGERETAENMGRRSRNQVAREKGGAEPTVMLQWGMFQKTFTTDSGGPAAEFVAAHREVVTGVLHGWDRLRLKGSLRTLYHAPVMAEHLRWAGVLYKDFKSHVTGLTERIRTAGADFAERAGAAYIYLASTGICKEDMARAAARQRRIDSGLAAVLACVEPCRTWFMRGNRAEGTLELKLLTGKCLHLYFYFFHEVLGWMHLRLQTWYPFLIHVCLNGREWLARRMDAAGLSYQREDNCFVQIEDYARAQALMDQQHRTDWPALLNALVAQCHPVHAQITGPYGAPREYYWSIAESEYATDIGFRRRADLERLYPALVRHSMLNFGSEEVLRFHSRQFGRSREVDVRSDCRRLPDGLRVKHWAGSNSQKMYDKGQVLRCETTINEARAFKVLRAAEGDPKGPKQKRILRRSVADTAARAAVSREACRRHTQALAAVSVPQPLAKTAAAVSRRVRRKGRSHRALQPLGKADGALLAAVGAGEHVIGGLRNRDVRRKLYKESRDHARRRRDMARTGRRLRLLRAHGLVRKVAGSHRYVVTPRGRTIITALQSARQADTGKLLAMAA